MLCSGARKSCHIAAGAHRRSGGARCAVEHEFGRTICPARVAQAVANVAKLDRRCQEFGKRRRCLSAASFCSAALHNRALPRLAHTPRDYMQQRVSRLHCSTSNQPGQCAHFHCTLWTEAADGVRVGITQTG